MKRTKVWDCLAGGGETGALMRQLDWARTPLGPVSSWPPSLRAAAALLLASTHPMYIAWGEDLVQLYNDAFREVLGPGHPTRWGGAPARPSGRAGTSLGRSSSG